LFYIAWCWLGVVVGGTWVVQLLHKVGVVLVWEARTGGGWPLAVININTTPPPCGLYMEHDYSLYTNFRQPRFG